MPKESNTKTIFVDEHFSPSNAPNLDDYSIGTHLLFVGCYLHDISWDDNELSVEFDSCYCDECEFGFNIITGTNTAFKGCYLDGICEDYDLCTLTNCEFGNIHNDGWRNFRLCDGHDTEGVTVQPIVPSDGAFIGWKKCIATLGRTVNTWIRKPVIVKLQIPARAQRISTNERKCRCSEAKVLDIQNLDGTKAEVSHAYSAYAGCGFRYEVGKIVYADKFDTDPLNTCSHGINFFITRQEAVDFSVAI